MYTSKFSKNTRDAIAKLIGISTTKKVDGHTKRLSDPDLFYHIFETDGADAARKAVADLGMEYNMAVVTLTAAKKRFNDTTEDGRLALMYEALTSTICDALSFPGSLSKPVSKTDTMLIEHAKICFWMKDNHLMSLLGIERDEIVRLLSCVGVSIPKSNLSLKEQRAVMDAMSKMIEDDRKKALEEGEESDVTV